MWGDVWNTRFWDIRNGFTSGPDNIIHFFSLLSKKLKKKKVQIINFFDF
jgi:hypothetical protein